MSDRKMHGKYHHNLLAHAALMYRIISGESANVEDEERVISEVKRHAKMTDRKKEMLGLVFLRRQVEESAASYLPPSYQRKSTTESLLSRKYKALGCSDNTRISIDLIKKHPREWQVHLESIADFVSQPVWISNSANQVEFNDVDSRAAPSLPLLHHFREWSCIDEQKYLKQCWQNCLEMPIKVSSR